MTLDQTTSGFDTRSRYDSKVVSRQHNERAPGTGNMLVKPDGTF